MTTHNRWDRREWMGLVIPGSVLARGLAAAATVPAKLPKRVLYYGVDRPLPAQLELEAGPLRMIFEPELAFLHYIRYGGREVVRGLYAAVRDRNWGTVAPKLSNLRVETGGGGFRVSFEVDCKEGPIDFGWKGRITGDSQGTVEFEMDGAARSTFLRNRIGFCILHPIEECAGQPCTVEKSDGSVERGSFPGPISPHQPFLNMRAIRHTVAPGVEAEVRFAGDIFEMEDQRNWTDGSYKTYCTPLALPYPHEVKASTRVRQSVTLRLKGSAAAVRAAARPAETRIAVAAGKTTPVPKLGVGLPAERPRISEKQRALLKQAGFSHLRVDLALAQPRFAAALDRADEEARAMGAELELAVTLGPSPEAELSSLAERLRSMRARVARVLVYHPAEKSTTAKWMELARRRLPGMALGSGTNAYFTELNRERPPIAVSDVVTYSINPQVHAFDNASLVETLEMHRQTLDSARQFCGKLPLVVSPVTLRPRFNPNATDGGKPGGAPAKRLPFEVDVRQVSLFGAGWTAGSLKYLGEGGAAAVTFYETVGWRGLMESEQGPALPDQFPSAPGMVFPLYHVLADAGEFAGGEVVASASSDKLRVEALVLRKQGRTRILAANLSAETQAGRIEGHGLGQYARVRYLDEHSAGQAMSEPEKFRAASGSLVETEGDSLRLSLLPYAVARIDSAPRR